LKEIETGTILKMDEKIICVVELKNSGEKKKIKQELSIPNVKIDKIIFLDKIPRDLRHNSKIDYEKLKKLISEETIESIVS
jgi:hypothetical protein